MIIRYESQDGQSRINVDGDDTIGTLLSKISDNEGLSESVSVGITLDNKTISDRNDSRKISDLGIKHGSTLSVIIDIGDEGRENDQDCSQEIRMGQSFSQDKLDDFMSSLPKSISRERDPLLCAHGEMAKCANCMSITPYEETYHKDKGIKHLSFYAYLAKCQDNLSASTSKSGLPYHVENIDLSVKIPCPSKRHKPWPENICTMCAPPSIVIQTQNFRMVDHIEFDNANMIERFVGYWRSTGFQRFGYIYGKYKPYLDVPLGIKATVSAIYEPPQDSTRNEIQLHLPNEQLEEVDKLAMNLGLTRLGMIYTDILDDGTGTEKVICKRHINSYYLSSSECIISAKMQLENPTRLKCSKTGVFSSRAVTCVITGNTEGNIDILCYQISNLGEALVGQDHLEPCVDPTLIKLRMDVKDKFVPTILYPKLDASGAFHNERVNPVFPAEFLLVTCSHGFPREDSSFFKSKGTFPVENRQSLEQQNFTQFGRSLEKEPLREFLSDFHVLFFLQRSQLFDADDLKELYNIVLNPESEILMLTERNNWKTLETIVESCMTNPMMADEINLSARNSSQGFNSWECMECTFINFSKSRSCEMCGSQIP